MWCWQRWTAMHWAAANGHMVVVEVLLEAGADLLAKNNVCFSYSSV
jgi:ankyrin repeat protein